MRRPAGLRNVNPNADITPDPKRHHVADPVRHQENKHYEEICKNLSKTVRNLRREDKDLARELLLGLRFEVERLLGEIDDSGAG